MLIRWWSLAFAIAATMLLLFFAVSSAGVAVLEDPRGVMGSAHPVAGVIGVLLLIGDVFLPVPSSLIMAAHGALFGTLTGTLLSLGGSVASALTAFAIGRAGNGVIRRFVTDGEHERAGVLLKRWGLVAIAATRPVPILAETVAILAGSSPVTWRQLTLAAAAGSIVPAAVYAWAGAHAHDMATQNAIFLGVLAVSGILLLVGRRSVLIVTLLVCAPLRGQVVITVEREAIPRDEAAAAVTVLERQQIESVPAASLSELLAYVPGVTMIFDSGASGAPMIISRGFFGGGEVEYVKLLVDGVPSGDAESGNVDWRRFRAADIERMEIVHGPGSSLYGDAALGGVIQLFTRDRRELSVVAGSFGTREIDASYLADLGAYRLAVAASTAETDGYRDHARAEDRSIHLSLRREREGSRLRLDADAARKDRREPGPLTRAEIAQDRRQSKAVFGSDRDRTDRTRLSAAFESDDWLASAYMSHRDGETLRTLLLAPEFGTSALRELATRTYGASVEASRGPIRAGLDLDRSFLDGHYGPAISQRGRRDRAGLFVAGAWNVCERCRLSAGIRRDELRDDFSSTKHDAAAWSPRLGLNVRAGSLSLFTQLSHAFKAPTLDQLFDPRPYPDGAGGSFTVSNPTLRPQRARNIEVGMTSARFSFVAYRMRVTDEIDFDPQTFTYRNLGSSLHRGIETSVAFPSTSRLTPRVTYAWTRVSDSATPDRQLKNIPEHVAQLFLRARLTETLTADAIYRWTSGILLDDDATHRTPAVSRIDLRLTRDFARLRLHLDVLNALDAEYNDLGYVLFDFFTGNFVPVEYPAPGRAVRVGAAWRY